MHQIDTTWTPVRMAAQATRQNLVIVRTGKQSLHTSWLKDLSEDRNWDLLLSHYGSNEPTCSEAEIIVKQGAFKYSACYRLFKDIPWLQNYKAIWFCDDDIMTSWSNINRMFDLFHQHELLLAQPALTKDSYFSHQLTLQSPEYLMRFMSFVEIMVPLMSTSALHICLPSFEEAVTAWGLDFVWPHLLEAPPGKTAIIDATPVRHTRPVTQGEFFLDAAKTIKCEPYEEMERTLAKYNAPKTMSYFGYIAISAPPSGKSEPSSCDPALIDYHEALAANFSESSVNGLWQQLPKNQQQLPKWQSGNGSVAEFHQIPPLSSQDALMSFGLTLSLEAPNVADVVQIGDERHQARCWLSAEPAGDQRYRLKLYVRGTDNNCLSIPLAPLLPLKIPTHLKVQLVPGTGYIKIWINDYLVEQGLFTPWEWSEVSRVWLGSKPLQGEIQSCWISPTKMPPPQ